MADRSSLENPRVPRDRGVILSTLWIFATLNYVYADVFSLFFDKEALNTAATMSAGFVFFFAVTMETAIAMVILSRVLPHAANRWTNVGIGILHTLLVAYSLTQGTPAPFYVFFAAVELVTTLFIIWYAWTWREQKQTARS